MSRGRKQGGQVWLAIFGMSAVFAVYTLATQESAPEPTNAGQELPAAQQPAVGANEASGTAYVDRSASVPATFMGYSCTGDCSGHEAGYDWAEGQGITDPDECDGKSDSFIEGCEAYAEEAAEEFSDDYGY